MIHIQKLDYLNNCYLILRWVESFEKRISNERIPKQEAIWFIFCPNFMQKKQVNLSNRSSAESKLKSFL